MLTWLIESLSHHGGHRHGAHASRHRQPKGDNEGDQHADAPPQHREQLLPASSAFKRAGDHFEAIFPQPSGIRCFLFLHCRSIETTLAECQGNETCAGVSLQWL